MDLAKRLWEGDALEYVRKMAARIDMTRTQLSQVVCEAFDFRDALGRLREMACRKVLAKMAAQGGTAAAGAAAKHPGAASGSMGGNLRCRLSSGRTGSG